MLDWNISFIKQYWRYLHSGEVWVNQENWTAGISLISRYISDCRGTFSRHHYLVTWIWQILISQILIHSYVQMTRYFSKSHDPMVMTLLAPGEKCHLDFSPKSCIYPTLATTDPPEAKIISILLYKDNNCPTQFCTFTIENILFFTTVKKKKLYILIFSKRVSDS